MQDAAEREDKLRMQLDALNSGTGPQLQQDTPHSVTVEVAEHKEDDTTPPARGPLSNSVGIDRPIVWREGGHAAYNEWQNDVRSVQPHGEPLDGNFVMDDGLAPEGGLAPEHNRPIEDTPLARLDVARHEVQGMRNIIQQLMGANAQLTLEAKELRHAALEQHQRAATHLDAVRAEARAVQHSLQEQIKRQEAHLHETEQKFAREAAEAAANHMRELKQVRQQGLREQVELEQKLRKSMASNDQSGVANMIDAAVAEVRDRAAAELQRAVQEARAEVEREADERQRRMLASFNEQKAEMLQRLRGTDSEGTRHQGGSLHHRDLLELCEMELNEGDSSSDIALNLSSSGVIENESHMPQNLKSLKKRISEWLEEQLREGFDAIEHVGIGSTPSQVDAARRLQEKLMLQLTQGLDCISEDEQGGSFSEDDQMEKAWLLFGALQLRQSLRQHERLRIREEEDLKTQLESAEERHRADLAAAQMESQSLRDQLMAVTEACEAFAERAAEAEEQAERAHAGLPPLLVAPAKDESYGNETRQDVHVGASLSDHSARLPDEVAARERAIATALQRSLCEVEDSLVSEHHRYRALSLRCDEQQQQLIAVHRAASDLGMQGLPGYSKDRVAALMTPLMSALQWAAGRRTGPAEGLEADSSSDIASEALTGAQGVAVTESMGSSIAELEAALEFEHARNRELSLRCDEQQQQLVAMHHAASALGSSSAHVQKHEAVAAALRKQLASEQQKLALHEDAAATALKSEQARSLSLQWEVDRAAERIRELEVSQRAATAALDDAAQVANLSWTELNAFEHESAEVVSRLRAQVAEAVNEQQMLRAQLVAATKAVDPVVNDGTLDAENRTLERGQEPASTLLEPTSHDVSLQCVTEAKKEAFVVHTTLSHEISEVEATQAAEFAQIIADLQARLREAVENFATFAEKTSERERALVEEGEALRELVHSTAHASERELVKASTDQQEVSSEFQKRLVEHDAQQKLWEVAMEEASDVQEALKMQLREQEERSEIKLELVKARQVQLQQQLNARTFELESLRKQQERSAEHEAQLQADLERANARVATLEELAGELVAEHESARQEWDSTEDSRAASLRDFVCRVELLELDLERADIKRLALEKELAAATAANEEQAVGLERAMAAVAEVGVARSVLVSELYTSESQAVQIGNMAERTADLVATLYEEVQERQREAASQLELEREERALECARLLEEGRASTAEVLSATKREWEAERDQLEQTWTRLIERERTSTSSLQEAMADAERTMEAQAHSMKRELTVLLERESVLAEELEVLREQQRRSAEHEAQLHADLERATARVATLEAVAGDLVAEHEHARQDWDSTEEARLRDSVGRVDQLELELERAGIKQLALETELAAATAANEEQAVRLERAMAAIAEVGVARRVLVSELYTSESQALQLGNMAERTADLVAALQKEAEQRQHEAASQLELEREERALECARLLEEGRASTAEVLSAAKREWEAERDRLEKEWTTHIERERAATSSLQAALADAERAMERHALEKSLEGDERCSSLEAQLTDLLSEHKVLLKDVSDLEEHRAEDKRIIAAMEAAVREQANAEQAQDHSMNNEFSILLERESVLAAELEVLREQKRRSAEHEAQLHADLERATARVATLEAVASLAEHEHARPIWDSAEEARVRDSVGRVEQLEQELERADIKRLALEKELAASTAANEEQAVRLERAMAAIAEVGVARRVLVSELYSSESQASQLGNMAEQTADLVAALQKEAEQRQHEAASQLELERKERALECARLLEEGRASTAEVLSAAKREWEAERDRLEKEWTTHIERERAATSSLRVEMADAERAMERHALEKSLEADARCSRLEAELKQELAHQKEEYEGQLNVRMLEHERGLQMLSTSSKQLQDAQVEAARLAAEHEENMNSQQLELHKAQYYSQYLEQQLEMAKSSQKDLIDRVNSLQKAEEHAALERSKALDNLREHSRRELQEALRRAKASHELLSKQQADTLLNMASEEKEAALRELQVELEEKHTLELRELEEQHTAELSAALKESKYSLLDLKSEHASTLLKCIEHEREIERLNDVLSRRSSELEHVRNDLRAKSQELDNQMRAQAALRDDRLEDVRAEGYAKGFTRGREEGRQEGREEGKQMHAQALNALREELDQATAQVQEANEKTQLLASEQREAVAREARSAAMAEAQVALASLRSTLAKNQLQAVDAAVHRCREEMESTVTELQLELATQKESIERERRAREADRESLLRLRAALSSEREDWEREREQLNDEIKTSQRQCKEAKRAAATLQERLHGMEEQLTAHAKMDEPGDELRHASDVEDALQSMKKECDTLRAERDFLQCKCTLLHTECEKLRTDSREASAASRRAAEQLRALAEESEILRKAQQEAEDELDSRAETSIREAQGRAEQLQVALERSETARRTLEEQFAAANAKLDRSDEVHQKDLSLLEQQLRSAAALGDARCSVLKSEMRSIENQLWNAKNSAARAEALAPTLERTAPLDICNGDGLKRLAMETMHTSPASLSDSTAASLSQLALISQRDELAAWLEQLSDRKDAEWELVVQAHVASYDGLSKQLEDVRRTASQERVQAILQAEARARAQIDAAREEANSSRADVEAARLEADAARAEAAAISLELQDALADCAQARREVSKLEQDVAAARAERDHVRAMLDATDMEREHIARQLENARRLLESKEAAARASRLPEDRCEGDNDEERRPIVHPAVPGASHLRKHGLVTPERTSSSRPLSPPQPDDRFCPSWESPTLHDGVPDASTTFRQSISALNSLPLPNAPAMRASEPSWPPKNLPDTMCSKPGCPPNVLSQSLPVRSCQHDLEGLRPALHDVRHGSPESFLSIRHRIEKQRQQQRANEAHVEAQHRMHLARMNKLQNEISMRAKEVEPTVRSDVRRRHDVVWR